MCEDLQMNKPCEFQQLIDPVSRIVRQAGQLVLSRQRDVLRVTAKGTANYVTEIDLAVQKMILEVLAILTPDYAIIAEESDANQENLLRPTWILDPLDGTTNLMRDYRHSAISLALACEGELVLGWILNPYQDELFSAVRGQGAWLNGQVISASSVKSLSDSLIGFGTTPYARDRAHQTFTLVETVFMQSLEVRRSGAAALDLAYVACGRLDGFFEMSLSPWDYAAGRLILDEAGGCTTTWQGGEPSLVRPDSILATNGSIHQPLLDLIRTI